MLFNSWEFAAFWLVVYALYAVSTVQEEIGLRGAMTSTYGNPLQSWRAIAAPWAAPVGLVLMDKDYRYVRINERMAEINGLPVVFVRRAQNEFEARTVKTGQQDAGETEILEGLTGSEGAKAGDTACGDCRHAPGCDAMNPSARSLQ